MGVDAERMREQRRAQIIAVAKEVFAELGYHKASVNDVIERAGIARGTFYLYFTGKANVFETLLDEALAALRKRIRRIDVGRGAPSALSQLRETLLGVLQSAYADHHFTRLLLTLWMNPDIEVAEKVEVFYAHVTALIASSLETGMKVGLVRKCDPNVVAPWLLGAVRGSLAHTLAAKSPPELHKVAAAWIDLAVRGIGTGRLGA